MWKVYQQVACSRIMVLMGKLTHAGDMKCQQKNLNQSALQDFWYQWFMAGIFSNQKHHFTSFAYHLRVIFLLRNLPVFSWMVRSDIIAQLYYARRLAEKLQPCARMIELHGGHLVSHERTDEVLDLFVMNSDTESWFKKIGWWLLLSQDYL